MRNKRGNKRPTRNREGTDSNQGSDAEDKATGKGQTVNPSDPRHNSADNLADENQRRLMELAANLAKTYSRVDQDSSPAQSLDDDSPSTSPEKPAPLKLKKTYTELTSEEIEEIAKDLKSGDFTDQAVADRWGVSSATVSRIKSNIRELPLALQGQLTIKKKTSSKQKEGIIKDLKSGLFIDKAIADRWGVSSATVSRFRLEILELPLALQGQLRKRDDPITSEQRAKATQAFKDGWTPKEIVDRWGVPASRQAGIRRDIMRLPLEARGQLKENYKVLTSPEKIEGVTEDLKSGLFKHHEIAYRWGVSASTVTSITSDIKKLSPEDQGKLRKGNYSIPSEKRARIAEDLKSGLFIDKAITRRRGVSSTTVRNIRAEILKRSPEEQGNLLGERSLLGKRIWRPPIDRFLSPSPSTSQEQPANQQHVAGNEASLLDNSLRHSANDINSSGTRSSPSVRKSPSPLIIVD